MRRRVQWGLGIAFLMAAVGLGCGRQDSPRSIEVPGPPPPVTEDPAFPAPASTPVAERPPSSEQTPAPSPTPAPTPTPAPGPTPTPPSSSTPVPAAQWWQVYPEPSPMPSEIPACVPKGTPTGMRFAHPCTVKKFSLPWDTTAEALQRWDAQGNLLEDAEGTRSDGTWGRRTLCTYTPHTASCETTDQGQRSSSSLTTYDDQGRKVRLESLAYDSAGRMSTRSEEWTYDGAGRLVRHTSGTPAPTLDERTTYDDQGRLASTVHYSAGSDGVWWVYLRARYRYGQEGWLLGIDESADQDDYTVDWSPYRTFTYHPNGQLKSKREDLGPSPNCSCYSTQEFDEQGRPSSAHMVGDEFEWNEAWTYSNQGRNAEMHLDGDSSQGLTHAWCSRRYDDAGRLALERDIGDSSSWDSPSIRRVISFTRSTYACETGDLLQEEWDTHGDGVRDGLHELQRDAAGNLQVERFSGSSVTTGSPYPRIEYDYSCLQ